MWKTVKLGDVIEIARGGSPRPIKDFITTEDDGINWIKIGDTKQGGRYIHTTKQKIKPSGISRSRYVKENDFLLSNSMSFGRPYILKTSGCIHDGWLVLSGYQELFSADYLYYLLSSSLVQNQFESLARGSTVRNLNIELVSQVTVLVPPLAEQERIVAKLDAAFAEIDRTIEVVKNKITEISSLYENAVTAEFISIENPLEKKLSDVCEKITDGTHQTPKYFDEGYIFLSSKNVTSRKIDWENVRYIDETQHIQMHKRIAPRIGDVLLAKNGTTGVAAIVDKDIVFDIYVSLAWLRSKGDVLPEYLLEFVNSKMAREQFTSRTKGIGVPNLHLQEIREVIIRFPQDKEKQKLLIRKLKNIDDTCNRCKQINKEKHQNLVSLKSAILAQELQPQQSEVA